MGRRSERLSPTASMRPSLLKARTDSQSGAACKRDIACHTVLGGQSCHRSLSLGTSPVVAAPSGRTACLPHIPPRPARARHVAYSPIG